MHITTTEFGPAAARFQDIVAMQPVFVGENGHDIMVVISVNEYQRLKRRDRQVLSIEEFTEEDAEAVRRSEPPPESAMFDYELLSES